MGTELLDGRLGNANLAWLCARLREIGVAVVYSVTVPDDEGAIAAAIGDAAARTDAVVITGGLGPTHDDVTREALAAAAGVPLQFDPDLEGELRRFFDSRGRIMSELNLRQAYLPEGAVAIANPLGTAPGIRVPVEQVPVFALPGVPAEMEAMMSDRVLPELAGRAGGSAFYTRILRAVGRGESEMASMAEPVIDSCRRAGSPEVTILSSRGEISFHLSTAAPDREKALQAIAPAEERLRRALGSLVYGADDDTLESVVLAAAEERGLTLATAESFTGGGLAARIVSVPGASKVFLGGFVPYAIETKVQQLGVPARTIEEHGAVSEATARAMAEGARARIGAGIGLATTGEAGPDAGEEPVGTMWIGLAHEHGSFARKITAAGGRRAIRDWGARAALDELRHWLAGGEPG